MPGPGDFCHGCNRLLCRCLPEPEYDAHCDESYEAGYEACLADGYSERPMTEWMESSAFKVTWDAESKEYRYHMAGLRVVESTWRHHHANAQAYRRWFERQFGYDLEAYLAGYDDAGAGLPSAVDDERAHARAEAALDAYAPPPEASPSPPVTVGADDGLPF